MRESIGAHLLLSARLADKMAPELDYPVLVPYCSSMFKKEQRRRKIEQFVLKYQILLRGRVIFGIKISNNETKSSIFMRRFEADDSAITTSDNFNSAQSNPTRLRPSPQKLMHK